jgi:hypothetical protein
LKVYRASRWSAIGLIGDPAQKTVLDEAGFLMEAFTGTGKLVRKATSYEQQTAEAALLALGSQAARARPSSAAWISVTRRFFRRG